MFCPHLLTFLEELREPPEAQTRMLMSTEKDCSYFARLNFIRSESSSRALLPFNVFL